MEREPSQGHSHIMLHANHVGEAEIEHAELAHALRISFLHAPVEDAEGFRERGCVGLFHACRAVVEICVGQSRKSLRHAMLDTLLDKSTGGIDIGRKEYALPCQLELALHAAPLCAGLQKHASPGRSRRGQGPCIRQQP